MSELETAVLPELPPETTRILCDKTIDIQQRLELGRSLAAEYGEIPILLRQSSSCDGMEYDDKAAPYDKAWEIMGRLGISRRDYATISHYEWRAPSRIHPWLYLRVMEGPLEIPGADNRNEAPEIWDELNHTYTYDLVVMPPPLLLKPSML